MSWHLDCRTHVVLSVREPLTAHDWQPLFESIVEKAEACGATSIVLPVQLPTSMGMAEELHRSLVNNLRERGLDVIEVG